MLEPLPLRSGSKQRHQHRAGALCVTICSLRHALQERQQQQQQRKRQRVAEAAADGEADDDDDDSDDEEAAELNWRAKAF
jgi:cysteine sulfinate desulfinase/cysteine desulfurase-like protein